MRVKTDKKTKHSNSALFESITLSAKQN